MTDSEDEDFDEEGPSLLTAVTMVRNLGLVREPERPVCLDGLYEKTIALTRSPRRDEQLMGLRLMLLLQVLSDFDDWEHVSCNFRAELHATAKRLWDEVTRDSVVLVPGVETDLWTAIALVRERATADHDFLDWLRPHALFVGGWPYPVVDNDFPTPAHSIVLSMARARTTTFSAEWTAVDAQRVWKEVAQGLPHTLEWLRSNGAGPVPDYFVCFPKSDPLIASPSGIRVETTELAPFLCLMTGLLLHGDKDFFERVSELVGSPAQRAALAKIKKELEAPNLRESGELAVFLTETLAMDPIEAGTVEDWVGLRR